MEEQAAAVTSFELESRILVSSRLVCKWIRCVLSVYVLSIQARLFDAISRSGHSMLMCS